MRRFSLAIVSFVFLLISNSLLAQNKPFTTDPLKFFDEYVDFMSTSKSEMVGDALKEFKDVVAIKVNPYTPDQMNNIIILANNMQAKKLRQGTEYLAYTNLLTNFIKGKANPADLDAYFIFSNKILLKSSADFGTYTDFISDLFGSKSLFKNNTTNWYTEGGYTLSFDTVPKLTINNGSLICNSKGGRVAIYNTTGVFLPIRGVWLGAQGRVNWGRVGLDSTKVFADFKKYKLNLKNSDFVIDTATLTNTLFLEKPSVGRLEEKILTIADQEGSTYPKFTSFQQDFNLKDIFRNVDYSGGFGMSGARVIGVASKSRPASITIRQGTKVVFRATAPSFIIGQFRINSPQARATFYIGDKDSIYHPGLEFRFDSEKQQVTLFRAKEGIAATAFYDSYHNMTFEDEAIYWKINEPSINVSNVESKVDRDAYFESNSYFREFKFRKARGLNEDYHPLTVLKLLCEQYKTTTLTEGDYAKKVGGTDAQIKTELRGLVPQGFIFYDEANKLIQVRPKAINWVKNDAGKMDYDIIRIVSLIDSGANAIIDLNTKEMKLRGVKQVFLSDSQSVNIIPSRGEMTILQDRNMRFGGKINAGTLEFYGKGFDFNYQEFKIGLKNIDSMKLNVLGEDDGSGNRPLIRVETVLQNIYGDLYVDNKDNKAGLKKKEYPGYPKFDSQKESFVYWDYDYIQKALYRRDTFYFKVSKFTIDSLDALTSTNGLSFPGTMHSGGIFPIFTEVISLQPDTTLGFITKSPEAGYANYKGKGTFKGTITLNRRGYYGKGSIDYLTSTAYDKNVLFLIDSARGMLDKYEVRKEAFKGVNYPLVNTDSCFMRWFPYQDTMLLYNKQNLFRMYDNTTATLTGVLANTPKNLNGRGFVKIKLGDFNSGYYVFNQDNFKSDSAKIRIYADTTKTVLSNNNTKATVNFTNKVANYKSNLGGMNTRLPANDYATTFDDFTWKFEPKTIDIKQINRADITSSEFLSLRKRQDSLRFNATSAQMYIPTQNIRIEGVALVNVADAEIYPDSNRLQLQPEAVIKTLSNAKIVATTQTRFHNIYKANVNILGAKNYSGNGLYDYKNKSGGIQTFKLYEIKVDTGFNTRARAKLADTAAFELNPKILFKGEVLLKAQRKYLNYEGFAKIQHESKIIASRFFKYEGEVNPDSLTTEIVNPRDEDNKRLFSGVHIANEGGAGYGTFVSKKIEPNDHNIITVEGELKYDPGTSEFRIASKERLFGTGTKGNYLAFNDKKERIYAEGNINYGIKYDSLKFKLKTIGSVTNLMEFENVKIDAVMAIDYGFLSKAQKIMIEDLKLNTFDASPTKDDKAIFIKYLDEEVPKKNAKKLIDDIRLYGALKMDKNLEHSFLFNEVKLQWVKEKNAYLSYEKDSKLGISVIGDELFSKKVKGKMKITRATNGNDVLEWYIEAGASWYYFRYAKDLIQAFSSNQDFNDELSAKTKEKTPFTIAEAKDKVDFLRTFEEE